VVTWCPTKNFGPIGSAVLTFIGSKQTGKPNLCIDKVVISVCLSGCLFVCISDHNSRTSGEISLHVNCPNWQKKVSLSQVEKLGSSFSTCESETFFASLDNLHLQISKRVALTLKFKWKVAVQQFPAASSHT